MKRYIEYKKAEKVFYELGNFKANDHEAVRDGVHRMLTAKYPDFENLPIGEQATLITDHVDRVKAIGFTGLFPSESKDGDMVGYFPRYTSLERERILDMFNFGQWQEIADALTCKIYHQSLGKSGYKTDSERIALEIMRKRKISRKQVLENSRSTGKKIMYSVAIDYLPDDFLDLNDYEDVEGEAQTYIVFAHNGQDALSIALKYYIEEDQTIAEIKNKARITVKRANENIEYLTLTDQKKMTTRTASVNYIPVAPEHATMKTFFVCVEYTAEYNSLDDFADDIFILAESEREAEKIAMKYAILNYGDYLSDEEKEKIEISVTSSMYIPLVALNPDDPEELVNYQAAYIPSDTVTASYRWITNNQKKGE